MNDAEILKQIVREKYAHIVTQTSGATCCCGTGGGSCSDYTTFSEDYTKLEGYQAGADLMLGCGIPTEVAHISLGDTVIDLGAGAGNDAFVARALTGAEGRVIGVDMTPEMITRARHNAEQSGFSNVEFRLGEIEHLPVADGTADVVISNCVLNLVPNKVQAFSEIYRVLKTGGHFSISDVVLTQKLPQAAKYAAELYAGCVSGAMLKDDFLALIEDAGFTNLRVELEKALQVPEELLRECATPDELEQLDLMMPLALSVTVYGEKV